MLDRPAAVNGPSSEVSNESDEWRRPAPDGRQFPPDAATLDATVVEVWLRPGVASFRFIVDKWSWFAIGDMPFISLMELNPELKKRKEFEPTSMARAAASTASISAEEVMPLLASAPGQSI